MNVIAFAPVTLNVTPGRFNVKSPKLFGFAVTKLGKVPLPKICNVVVAFVTNSVSSAPQFVTVPYSFTVDPEAIKSPPFGFVNEP